MSDKKIIEKSQQDKFKQTAKELNCDENEKIFDEKLKKITPKTSENEESN